MTLEVSTASSRASFVTVQGRASFGYLSGDIDGDVKPLSLCTGVTSGHYDITGGECEAFVNSIKCP